MTASRTAELYRTTQKRKLLIFGALLLLLCITAVIACGIGTVAIPPADVLAAFGHAVLPGLIDAPATRTPDSSSPAIGSPVSCSPFLQA